MNLRLRDSLFYFLIVWVFFLSGAFTTLFPGIKLMYGIIPLGLFYLAYKKVYLEFLVIFLVCLFAVVLSSIKNGIGFLETILFLRGFVSVYIIYNVLYNYYITRRVDAKLLFKILSILALVQPLVIGFQQFIYQYLPEFIIQRVHRIDFDFGTFSFKSDPSLAFFLILFNIFLLYRSGYIKNLYRYFLIAINTATIFVINSTMAHMAIVLVYFLYCLYILYYKSNYKLILILLLLLTSSFSVFVSTGGLNRITGRVSAIVNSEASEQYLTNFKQGRYSRVGAILYYLDHDLLLLGEGPGKYFDPLNNEYTLANTGHVFTYYAEIGIIGLLLSYLIIYTVISKITIRRYLGVIHWPAFNIFLVLLFMSITSYVITDIGFFMSIIVISFLLREFKHSNNKIIKCLIRPCLKSQ